MRKLSVLLLTSLVLICLTAVSITALNEPSTGEPAVPLTASERHAILAKGKAEKLGIRRNLDQTGEKLALGLNQEEFDAVYYRVEIDVDVPATTIYGDVVLTAASNVGGLSQINLDLVNDLTIDSVYIPGGAQLAFSHISDVIAVTLDQPYNTDEEFTVAVAYHGIPPSSGFVGFEFAYRYSKPVVSTLSEPYMARTWWPCKDRPDDKADSLDIIITCDTALYCASNGLLIDTVRNGDGTWTFDYEVRYPIATYLFSLAISDYTIWTDWYHYSPTDSMPIVHHVYSDQYMYSVPRWGVTPYAIEVLSGMFGEYPFINEKYGHANFEWGGGMEHQTVTSMTGSWFGFDTNTVVHELAHQWWGDMITCNNWSEIWLNEGFASYAEALFWEVADGETRFKEEMSGMEYYLSGAIYRYDTTDVWGIFSSIVYDKGAWVLHMLRRTVGDADFFAILQAYHNSAYQYGDATTAQFQGICEQVSGTDLDWFFDQWIYGTYHPIIQSSHFNEYNAATGNYYTYVRLNQTQTGQPDYYSAPLDISFTGAQTQVLETFMDARDSIYIFELPFSTSIMIIDPDNWLLNRGSNTSWTYGLIPFPPDSGISYEPYLDTLRARGGSGNNRFEIIAGAIPNGLVLDSLSGIISGAPTEWGDFSFAVTVRDYTNSSYNDENSYVMVIEKGVGIPGDVDLNDAVDVLDIIYLIDFKFKDGPAPEELILADVNNDCEVNVLDIIYLIDFKFKTGPEPQMGCATL